MPNVSGEMACVVLCGGGGTRMGSTTTHKVCFPVGGVPAILRTIEMLRGRGIRRIVIVVGAMAGQVIEIIGRRFPDVAFVYQHEQLGTGHAALIGVSALEQLGHIGTVLVTLGDKVIEPWVVDRMNDTFVRSQADLVFAALRKRSNDTSGRVFTDGRGRVIANIEYYDIQHGRLVARLAKLAASGRTVSGGELLDIGLKYISPASKLAKAIGPVHELMQADREIDADELSAALNDDQGLFEFDGRRYTADHVERASKNVNVSVYLFASGPLYDELPKLGSDNAQQEYYLTDIIRRLSAASDSHGERRYRVRQYVVEDESAVLAFNSPDELLVVEDHVRRKGTARGRKGRPARRDARAYKPVDKWIELFDRFGPRLRRAMRQIYGPDEAVLADRRTAFLRTLRLFARRFGAERKAVIARAPGRLNLMGRHIDHCGGHVNVVAIDREVIVVASPRDDDQVRIVNADRRQFPSQEFRIAELIGAMEWDDWLSYVNSEAVIRLVRRSAGDWGNYVKAAVLRLQQHYKDVRVLGMDCVVSGNVPMGAGLSSSSALVAATAEASVALNRLDVTPTQFMDLCGEGEWFADRHGRPSEHAGIRFGRRGSVAHIGFFPFKVDRIVQLPDDAVLVIADSHCRSGQIPDASDRAARQLACFEIGRLLMQDRHPQHAHLIEHVRDIRPGRLNLLQRDIYGLLMAVPSRITADQLMDHLSGRHSERVEEVLASHKRPSHYDVRGALLYAVSECERARRAVDLLEAGDIDRLGRLMLASHDGDRICKWSNADKAVPFDSEPTDAYLRARIEDLAGEDPDRVLAGQLYMVPGRHRLSLEEIDRMVDIAARVEGVYAAQLAGAGLGGCIMVLADRGAVPALTKALRKGYYRPLRKPAAVQVCTPVEGSGLLRLG